MTWKQSTADLKHPSPDKVSFSSGYLFSLGLQFLSVKPDLLDLAYFSSPPHFFYSLLPQNLISYEEQFSYPIDSSSLSQLHPERLNSYLLK